MNLIHRIAVFYWTDASRKFCPYVTGKVQQTKGSRFPVSKRLSQLSEYRDLDGSVAVTSLLTSCASTACKQEDGLYAPFVQASNIALAHLKNLKIDGMREKESKEVKMFFQRNDPNTISQNHAGHNSERKPDVVVLPFVNASEYFIDASFGSWDEHVGPIYDKKPMASPWKDVLSVFEFKRSNSTKGMDPPPATYTLSEYHAPKRKFLRIGKDGNELKEAEVQEVPVAEQVEPAEPALRK
jgi:hypothetical protein